MNGNKLVRQLYHSLPLRGVIHQLFRMQLSNILHQTDWEEQGKWAQKSSHETEDCFVVAIFTFPRLKCR